MLIINKTWFKYAVEKSILFSFKVCHRLFDTIKYNQTTYSDNFSCYYVLKQANSISSGFAFEL